MHIHTLILGAGITGLSTAYHLEKRGRTDYLLVDKNPQPGGLCISQVVQGFTFDQSGHLWHMRTLYAKKLLRRLLPGNLQRVKRHAWIYTQDKKIPFPFQAHLSFTGPETAAYCAQQAVLAAKRPHKKPTNFEQWCLSAFGKGIYQHFLRPYNTKLWGTTPQNLTWDWCGSFVPKPNLEEILQGALGKQKKSFGYNTYFYYPKRGGCQAITDALAGQITQLRLNAPVQKIDLDKKEARVGGQIITYDQLVSTLPLSELARLVTGPILLKKEAEKLTHTSVSVFNFSVEHTAPRKSKNISWIYCPDEQDPFYRVGVQSSFSAQNAPTGCSSFYVEFQGVVAHSKILEKRIFKALAQKGIIEKEDKILFSFWQTLPYAYAVYDKNRKKTVQKMLTQLGRRGCFCAGRYGRWEYSFMENNLLQGQDLAEKLI